MYLTNNTVITKMHALERLHIYMNCVTVNYFRMKTVILYVLDIILQTIHRPFDALLHTKKMANLPK